MSYRQFCEMMGIVLRMTRLDPPAAARHSPVGKYLDNRPSGWYDLGLPSLELTPE
jgi:hypothetical protein